MSLMGRKWKSKLGQYASVSSCKQRLPTAIEARQRPLAPGHSASDARSRVPPEPPVQGPVAWARRRWKRCAARTVEADRDEGGQGRDRRRDSRRHPRPHAAPGRPYRPRARCIGCSLCRHSGGHRQGPRRQRRRFSLCGEASLKLASRSRCLNTSIITLNVRPSAPISSSLFTRTRAAS